MIRPIDEKKITSLEEKRIKNIRPLEIGLCNISSHKPTYIPADRENEKKN